MGLRDVKVGDGYRPAFRRPIRPGWALGIVFESRDKDGVLAVLVGIQVRLLTDDRGPFNGGVGLLRKVVLAGGVVAANEDHIPHGIRPASPFAVSRKPLLL